MAGVDDDDDDDDATTRRRRRPAVFDGLAGEWLLFTDKVGT